MSAATVARPTPTNPCAPSVAVAGLSPTALAVLHYLRLAGPSRIEHIAAALEVGALEVIEATATLAERGLALNAGGNYVQARTA